MVAGLSFPLQTIRHFTLPPQPVITNPHPAQGSYVATPRIEDGMPATKLNLNNADIEDGWEWLALELLSPRARKKGNRGLESLPVAIGNGSAS
ncbi:MAG: hypothetical protein JWR69_4797 [Pedosphaera sp.]|nr:hypothetical protein [Pedosphaera sp.]